MNHQLLESWILDEDRLNTEEDISLKLHLQTCPDCRSLLENWQIVNREIHSTAPVPPPPGFTDRWIAGLAKRRRQEYKYLERRLMIFLITAFIFTLGTILSGILLFTSPASMFAGIFEILTRISIAFHKFMDVVFSILGTLPPIVPATLLILGSIIFGLASFFWIGTIWRISKQRAQIS